MDAPNWTPTQSKMLAVLADREAHPARELHACLRDELGGLGNVRPHLTALRRKLLPLGESVMHVREGGVTCYRLVCLRCRCHAGAE